MHLHINQGRRRWTRDPDFSAQASVVHCEFWRERESGRHGNLKCNHLMSLFLLQKSLNITHSTFKLQMNSFDFEASVQLYVLLVQPSLCLMAELPSLIVCVDVKEAWLYHLSVAAGTTLGKVGTEFEQLVGKLYQQDGDTSESLDHFSSFFVQFLCCATGTILQQFDFQVLPSFSLAPSLVLSQTARFGDTPPCASVKKP